MNDHQINYLDKFPLLNSVVKYWAGERSTEVAMIQHEDGKSITYKKFASFVDLFALRLLDIGLKKGDRIATQLVLIPEHVILMYACFKIGVIIAPLDLRLKPDEVVRDINKIEPKMFFFLGKTPVIDFTLVGIAVRENCPSVEHLIQFVPKEEASNAIDGAVAITNFLTKSWLVFLKLKDVFAGGLKKASQKITPQTPALIIYTTGTTGAPKPALLSHQNILVQNQVLSQGLGSLAKENEQLVTMVNLPPSHVGCVTETLMTTFYQGGKAVLLRIFDVTATLEAIEKHKVSLLGQIPTQYRMLWNHPDYDSFDLSSLLCVIYAGAAGDLSFLKRLAKMAPYFATGLGMTENAGFATFSPLKTSPEDLVGQVGRAFPELAEVSIRNPMNENGSAGGEVALGETGEICYHPPIVFLGYFNQPEETKKAISTEGILYTGDLGHFKEVKGYKALFLSGRRKFVIKQKGYNVFPGEVEEHLLAFPGVAEAVVVGAKHKIFDEAIFAFVKPFAGGNLDVDALTVHCKKIAAYKRPQHIEVWPADKDFPLTRSTKIDKLGVKTEAESVVENLRKANQWDA